MSKCCLDCFMNGILHTTEYLYHLKLNLGIYKQDIVHQLIMNTRNISQSMNNSDRLNF